jgi:CheY-like chemotaxis protein
VLKALKENPDTTHIPVIVLSSLSQQNEERLIGQGAAAYFEKSTLELDKGSDRLATTIQSVLNRARKQSKPQA